METILKTNPKAHVTQVFNINAKESELDFFDTNLNYDSRLFIDPFLIKTSEIEEERKLYERFTVYFQTALDKSITASNSYRESHNLYEFFYFKEPKEICLGYTEKSNDGSGLNKEFASGMYKFFIEGIISKFISNKDLYINKLINPEVFVIFANKVNQDGISDLSANLTMDYLIKYTQAQCIKWNIKIDKFLPVRQTFDTQNLTWTAGRYYRLPENPFKPGEPFILVPKRFLRADINVRQDAKKEIRGILSTDPELASKFSNLIEKPINEITLEELREALINESVLKKFIGYLEKKEVKSYDFNIDPLAFYAFKKYENYFKDFSKFNSPINCIELLNFTKQFLSLVKEEFELRDSWLDTWVPPTLKGLHPCKEIVWGRIIRGMGSNFFYHWPNITFSAQFNTANGSIDFCIIYKDCKIAIELKKLANDALTGSIPKLPAYIHGIVRQLPAYILNVKAKYAFYITGQHYKETVKVKGKELKNHDGRIAEVQKYIPNVINQIKEKYPDFQDLFYINIDLSKKLPPSKL